MLRLLTAALLTTTAQGSCPACMKYLDETWRTACNQTWAEAKGYHNCPPPASGCCNSNDAKCEQYGSDSCPPQILSFEQGIWLEAACSENEDICPEPELAPGFVVDNVDS